MSFRTESPAREFRRGLAAAMPVMFAVIAYGLVFGAQAIQRGLRFPEVPLMTGSNYAGGSEFAAIGLWASPPPILLIAAVTLLINSRHLIMGAALTPHLRRFSQGRALLALFFMSDESWALSHADIARRTRAGHPAPFSPGFYAGGAAAIYLGWLAATTAGAAIGPFLGDITRYGFDMAFPAVFLVLLAGLWKGPRAALPWLVSLIIAAVTYLVIPGSWYVIAGATAGLACAALQTKPQ